LAENSKTKTEAKISAGLENDVSSLESQLNTLLIGTNIFAANPQVSNYTGNQHRQGKSKEMVGETL
jgi:hypothetical protein